MAPQRCRSWRPAQSYPAGEHHPIGTRPWWRPCRSRLTDNEWIICRECALALADHPDPLIRMAIAGEDAGTVDADIIDVLMTDPEASVASLAYDHHRRLIQLTRALRGENRTALDILRDPTTTRSLLPNPRTEEHA